MSAFTFKKKQLHCENVSIKALAKAYGTPLYVYSYNAFTERYNALYNAFKQLDPLICFSTKANGNLAVLKTLVKEGSGLDIVSGGELQKALKVGCPPERIVFAGVGKTPEEIRLAIQKKILSFNVESSPELDAIEKEAKKLKRPASVALRVNPNVKPKTHKYITTGSSENKFGIPLEEAEAIILKRHNAKALSFCGLHIHIGSQITEPKPFVQALERTGALIERLRERGIDIQWLNMGGGLGIVYENEKPQTAKQFAKVLLPIIKKLQVRVIMEPGRFIAGNSGILVTETLYIKEGQDKSFAIVDAGMNDLIRPSLYEAYHRIEPVASNGGKAKTYDVVGPICESGDFFAKNRKLAQLKPQDLLAIFGAGAYGFTMASHYNARPNPAEVMVKGNRHYLIRKRETIQDLMKHDQIPSFLK